MPASTPGPYQEFADGLWLTKADMQWMWDAYAPNKADRKKITAAPLQATTEQLKGLPPALIITDENDILRDEGEAYARKLMQAGVEVTAVRCLGTFHDFVMLNGLADTPASKGAIQLASRNFVTPSENIPVRKDRTLGMTSATLAKTRLREQCNPAIGLWTSTIRCSFVGLLFGRPLGS